MTSINTNISALAAQKSLTEQSTKVSDAVQRLSSGLRINSASDDAAGSSIATKMESQVRSLGVAIRNGHDAISMTQTAEGALGEMENILQRVRELAVQAGNSTLSLSDRTAIQAEVTALTAEMNDIASTTNFNGVKLLDGSNKSVNFQLGTQGTDQLNVALENSKTSQLGLSGGNGTNILTSSRIEQLDVSSVAVDAIKINGQNHAVTQAVDTSSLDTGATLLAAAINTNTIGHGAVANAFNTVTSSAIGGDFKMTATFSLNGVTVDIQDSMADVVTFVNENVLGVNASLNVDDTMTLSNDDGGTIKIATATVTEIGFLVDDYEGFIEIENIDGSDVTIELGNTPTGYANAATATGALLQGYGFNQTSGAGNTKGVSVTNAVLSTTDQIKINGVQVGATLSDTAGAKADAINLISSESGVTASAETTLFLDLNFDIDATATSFELNGEAIDVNALNSVSDVAAAINTASVGVQATATAEGLLKLTDTGGGNISIDMSSLTTYVAFAYDSQFDVVTPAAAMEVFGSITLDSTDGGVIKLEDGTLTNTGLAKLGLEAQSETGEAGSAGVNVSTLSGATSSLISIDAAIDKLSSFRASFGAVENRIDAKINNLTTLKVNTQAAQSRIEDADFAAETTNMTKAQILSQAATSMLAQANSSKQNLLALLQG
jgi:flagellin